jgi:hypothetical protein
MRHASVGPDGTKDIENATAMGAALLAVHGADPVFASAIGVRLADAEGHFCPVFQPHEALKFETRERKFFISDASSGVARLLVCDQADPVLQPSGRLLRIIPVPIDTGENWLKVSFTLDPHLVLKIKASGEKTSADDFEPVSVQHLNLGFRLPPRTSVKLMPAPGSMSARA